MQDIERFLQSIEGRAFRMAQLATRNEADALDLVQEAMIKLVRHYAEKPAAEWRALFLKILENGILDWHRKEKLKRRIFFWRQDDRDAPESEHNEQTPQELDVAADPADALWSEQMGEHLLQCIEALPLQQQQCFLLRSWEGLSVNETAEVMGIHPNSVKTHYFRANEKLRQAIAHMEQHATESDLNEATS
ncbi:MAG: RNA polymerase sigma factor [Oleiphilaceae bacterium]|nr:RNA polymerase sigma factor [Oleiphilaceae bacterium]